MRTTSKLRFVPLLLASSSILVLCVLEIMEMLQSGVGSLPIGRHGPVLNFSRDENPIGFYTSTAFFILVAALFLWFVWRQVSALLKPGESANEHFIHQQVSSIERSAPSGLRPLWVGLAIAVVIGFCYVALASN
jgi:hypothetical protein